MFRIRRRVPAGALIAALLILLLASAPAPASGIPRGFFGIFAEEPDASDYDGMAAAGFGAYRVPVNWSSVQSSRDGGYDWHDIDRRVLGVDAVGMTPILLLYGTPAFVHEVPVDDGESIHNYPPVTDADLAEWRAFAAAAARRYGPGGEFYDEHAGLAAKPVHRWIVWNEQNTTFNWLPLPDPAQYAQLVRKADRGIKSADPGAEVILGGMFGYPLAPNSIQGAEYLARLYDVPHVERWFDAVNVHPYAATVGLAVDQIEAARSVMRAAGDGRTPILVGEIGWASSIWGEAGQARRLDRFLTRLVRNRSRWKIDGAVVYVWRDSDAVNSCFWCPYAGLIAEDRSAKQALGAVMSVIEGATGTRRYVSGSRGTAPPIRSR